MKILGKILGITFGVLFGFVAVLLVASRFSDGPLVEMLPGGPFTSGEIVMEGPSNWDFLAERQFVDFESAGRSRKSYIFAIDGDAYVGASLGFPPFKTWHEKALTTPEAVLRVDGKRYPRLMHKIEDPALRARLKAQGKKKYGGSPDESSDTWFFRLDPPA
ncbi:MAG: hypothetical protein ACI8W3_000757 [Myxococcota bacterium]|jgi:hypothetical protein